MFKSAGVASAFLAMIMATQLSAAPAQHTFAVKSILHSGPVETHIQGDASAADDPTLVPASVKYKKKLHVKKKHHVKKHHKVKRHKVKRHKYGYTPYKYRKYYSGKSHKRGHGRLYLKF